MVSLEGEGEGDLVVFNSLNVSVIQIRGGRGLTKGRLLYQISEEKNQYNTSFRSNISSEESDQIRVVTSGGRGLIKGRLLNCTRL